MSEVQICFISPDAAETIPYIVAHFIKLNWQLHIKRWSGGDFYITGYPPENKSEGE